MDTSTRLIKDTIIYALSDPRTGYVRYVGKTIETVLQRFNRHIRDSRRGKRLHVCNWIRTLFAENLLPKVDILEVVEKSIDWDKREQYWISYYRSLGCKLTNICSGGKGALGFTMAEESRKKMSDAWKTRPPISDETKRKRSENAKCEKSSTAKLTREIVLKIRNSDLSHAELGRMYGVQKACIYKIRKGLTWNF